MATFYTPSIVSDSLLLCLDAGSTKSYPGSGTTWTDISRNNRNFFLTPAGYYSFETSSRSISFTRNMPPAAETGGYAQILNNADGNLAATTYLYNNHTTEVWAKINNASPTNYDANEPVSALIVYRGYHAMFFYSASALYYEVWIGGSATVSAPSASIGTSNTNIIVGSWFQVAVTRNGSTFTTFINGVPIGTNALAPTSSVGVGTTNTIRIAMANNAGAAYTWCADCNVSTVRMYNRALAATEILQNFNATRGRYGL